LHTKHRCCVHLRPSCGQKRMVSTGDGGAKFFPAFFLGKKNVGCSLGAVLWKNGRRFVPKCIQMSGNPVKFRDGCATVTATIPIATALGREGGRRYEAGVRIPVCLHSSAPNASGHFSAKRRMGPVRRAVFGGTRRMPSFPVLPESGGFFLKSSGSALVSQLKPFRV